MTTRGPAVAGTFYPSHPAELRAMVEEDLAEAAGASAPAPVKAVIAPHAGYAYSGAVAGHAFARLRGRSEVRRVVVIGPAHFVPIHGIAVPSAVAFRTPLGDVPVDRAAVDDLRALPQVRLADAPHREEHALEVELPFLQAVLDGFTLVPLVVGTATPVQVAAVLARVWDGPETLIVVSSDLSHYETYACARHHDATTAAAIERLDDGAIGPADACGHLAIAGTLLEARRRGLRVDRLDLRNSGDTAGPKGQVVGYGAWAFTEPPPA